jgi:tRNA(Ile)-lysidine synthase
MARVHPLEVALSDALAACGVESAQTVLFAVSGGPDSMAMLTAIANLHETSSDQVSDFVAAHFNHRLRGPESEGDARYVRDFCDERGIVCEIGTGDVADFAKTHSGGLESASRTMRYKFLADAARRHGASAIATAHTRDDQAETILLHIVRGSGLAGLRGIQTVGPVPGEMDSDSLRLVRPLLSVGKTDTDSYCDTMGIRPRHDLSNDDLFFARNRIRHKILPEMRKLNPLVSEALIRLSEAAGADHEAIEAIVDDEWDIATHEDGEVLLPLAVLNHVPIAVGTRIIQRAYATFGPSHRQTLEAVHIKAILSASRSGAGQSVEIPAGVVVTIGYENASLSTGPRPIDCRYLPIEDQLALNVPGSVPLNPRATLTAELVTRPADTSGMPESTAYLDLHTSCQSLTVRNWIEGDRFQPLGMAGEKKLSDFFIDSKIPRDWRDRIPLVVVNDRIAWVAGYRIAEWAKVASETKNCVKLELADTREP